MAIPDRRAPGAGGGGAPRRARGDVCSVNEVSA